MPRDILSPMRPITVTELLGDVNAVLRPFRDLWVEGEVTNCSLAPSGHLYFSLKDAKSQIAAVMWATSMRSLRFRIENGMQLIVRGRLQIYEKSGRFQMSVDTAEPAGIGALQLAYEQLRKQLDSEGLFSEERKKPLPRLPQRIAVITSPTGAAIRDVLHVLGRRFSGLHVQVYPVRVQGPTAGREIAAAVRHLSRWQKHDVIILCRGGGSLEDLWAFNEEVVARAVADCLIPTISGVGHETDYTICDFVADHRAATPSAAAETVIQSRAELCNRVDHLTSRVRSIVEGRVARLRFELRLLASTDGVMRPVARVQRTRQRLDSERQRLDRVLRQHAMRLRARHNAASDVLRAYPARLSLDLKRARLDAVSGRAATALRSRIQALRSSIGARMATLDAVSPLAVLSRGYAIAYAFEGRRKRLLQDSSTVRPGDAVEVILKKGRLECTVDRHSLGLESTMPGDPGALAAPADDAKE